MSKDLVEQSVKVRTYSVCVCVCVCVKHRDVCLTTALCQTCVFSLHLITVLRVMIVLPCLAKDGSVNPFESVVCATSTAQFFSIMYRVIHTCMCTVLPVLCFHFHFQ